MRPHLAVLTVESDDHEDWRELDFDHWCELLGRPDHLLQAGKPYSLRNCYNAIRKQSDRRWPGKFFDTMDQIDMERWLRRKWSLVLPDPD
jgi:hypothetical protein